MKEISIKEIKNVRIGNVEDKEAATGCTVLIMEEGAPAGLDVRGGGPASRETELLKPLAHADKIHAILLAGGSAFGLDAAGGVMKYLEERNIGYDVGVTKVPLVCQSDIFDLSIGDVYTRPTQTMGYRACENAYLDNYEDGSVGAGCGATIGKLLGMDYAMKAGVGSYALELGDLQVGAIVVVNALGDVYNHKNGQKVAGLLSEDKLGFRDLEENALLGYEYMLNQKATNTTIGVILTNAKFNKSQLCKIAGMAHDGYARSIRPVHTSADGDSIYAVSLGDKEGDIDMIGTLAARVMSEAILRAVQNATSSHGVKALRDL